MVAKAVLHTSAAPVGALVNNLRVQQSMVYGRFQRTVIAVIGLCMGYKHNNLGLYLDYPDNTLCLCRMHKIFDSTHYFIATCF